MIIIQNESSLFFLVFVMYERGMDLFYGFEEERLFVFVPPARHYELAGFASINHIKWMKLKFVITVSFLEATWFV